MELYKTIKVNGGLIGAYQLDQSLEELENLYRLLYLEKAPIEEFRNNRRKKEWMAVRILLAKMIGIDYSINYSAEGKPQLVHSEYKFISISHSEEFASVYVHKTKIIGIDIESLDRKYSTISKKYLSEKESQHVKSDPLLLAIYWSCKEAIFKLAEKQGIDFRKQILIADFNPNKTNHITAELISETQHNIQLVYELFAGHVLVYTLC